LYDFHNAIVTKSLRQWREMTVVTAVVESPMFKGRVPSNPGKDYESLTFRIIKPGCGLKCHKQCHANINLEQRETLFHEFWQLGSLASQREYIARHVKKTSVGMTKKSSKHIKKQTLKHELMVDGKMIRVCKTFFMHR